MQFNDTPTMAAFRDEVRAFIDAEQPDYFRDGGDIEDPYFGDGSPPFRAAFREWRRRVARHGWIAPAWPKEYGGAGLGVLEQFVLNEEFAKRRVPRVGTDSGVMMAGPTIIAHGSEQQQREHLSTILTGETIWCQGFSEPGSGSDLASLQTRAVRDGDDYVINGQKIWTSGARHGQLDVRPRANRPGRAQAPRHLLSRPADGLARHQCAPDQPDERRRGLQRGLLRGCARAREPPHRRGEPRLVRGRHHA